MQIKEIIAALHMPGDVPNIIVRNSEILNCIKNSAWLPNPDPDITTYESHIKDLIDAQGAMVKGNGTVEIRDQKLRAVLLDSKHQLAYVQRIADGNRPHAREIILSAGMYIVEYKGKDKQSFCVVSEKAGTATLTCPVPDGKENYSVAWFKSSDGVNFEFDNATPVAETEFINLTSGNIYHFNYKITIGKKRMGDFHDPISCRIK